MEIATVKAYDRFWFDCKINLALSILQSIDSKYTNLALNNDYYYRDREVETGSGKHRMLEIFNRWDTVGEMFLNKTEIPFESDEEFFDAIINYMKNGKYIFIGVDLYYWNDENICKGRDHWFHSTLIQRYDEKNEEFYVFDVNNDRTYGIFKIKKNDLLLAARKGFEGGQVTRWSDIDLNPYVKNITKDMLYENSLKLIENLKEVKKSEYWKMAEKEYRIGAYEDLNIVHIGRYYQRQLVNDALFQDLKERKLLDSAVADEIINITKELSDGWLMLRYKIGMLYMQKNLDSKIENMNKKVQQLFDKEMIVWEKFGEEIKKLNDGFVVYNFN